MKSILLVDDDALVRETVRLALRHSGFHVRVADEPAKADEIARQEQPDLILLDLYMPNVDGLELARRLRSDEKTKKIPIVLFSGSTEDIDKLSAQAIGLYDYIAKPIEAPKLIAKIKDILNAG
jgi:CheY-like chemotaxis protein